MDDETKKNSTEIVSDDTKYKSDITSKPKRPMSMDEYQYYNLACLKLREENQIAIIVAIFLSAFILMTCSLLQKIDLQNIVLDGAFILIALAGLSLIGSIILSMISNNLLLRFLMFIRQKNVQIERKVVIHLFQKGYSYRQATTKLLVCGLIQIMLFFVFYVASLNIIFVLCILPVVVATACWLWYDIKRMNKTGAFRIPQKAIIIGIEPEESEIPPAATEEKSKFDDKTLVPAMQSILRSTSEHVRKDAIRILGKIATPEAIQILLSLLGDSSSTIRAQAIAALGRSGEKNIKEALYCLINDETVEVRVAVANALGLLHDEDAGDLLMAALEDNTPEVRGAAAEALGNIRYKKAMKKLIGHASDVDWFVRYNSVVALGKLKNYLTAESFQKIVDSLHDDHAEVRAAGLHVMQKLKKELAREDPLYPELDEIFSHISQEQIEDRQTATESDNYANYAPPNVQPHPHLNTPNNLAIQPAKHNTTPTKLQNVASANTQTTLPNTQTTPPKTDSTNVPPSPASSSDSKKTLLNKIVASKDTSTNTPSST